MDRATPSTGFANTLHCALELSKKSWLLAIQFPDREQPSLYPIEGGDAEKLMAKLAAARDCWAKVSGAVPVITLCYEVGHDAFWLARFLKARRVECLVIDPGSLQVNRRGRRVKTDRIDVKVLLRTLIAWCRGERHVWSLVRIPSVDEEDLRRSHRERGRLVRERTAHINRIKGLLFGQGIRSMNVKLIFYSSNLQGIDRAAKIAPEKRLGTTFWSIGWVGRDQASASCRTVGGRATPAARRARLAAGRGGVRSRKRLPSCSTSVSVNESRSARTFGQELAWPSVAMRSSSSFFSTKARKLHDTWPRMVSSSLWKIGRVANRLFEVRNARSTIHKCL